MGLFIGIVKVTISSSVSIMLLYRSPTFTSGFETAKEVSDLLARGSRLVILLTSINSRARSKHELDTGQYVAERAQLTLSELVWEYDNGATGVHLPVKISCLAQFLMAFVR
ncbi:hypothetical protein NL676_038354 [Syzygium grande]|nr:hypothetical protein NL676_038354 [Syzygium grande]